MKGKALWPQVCILMQVSLCCARVQRKGCWRKGVQGVTPTSLIELGEMNAHLQINSLNPVENRRREAVKQQTLLKGDGCPLKRIADEAEQRKLARSLFFSVALVLCLSQGSVKSFFFVSSKHCAFINC